MQLFATILHILLCFALILVILLQPGKDGASMLGGGVNSQYGPRANAHPLGRATTVIAALFMFTSIFLAWHSNERVRSGSDIEEEIRKLQEEEEKAATSSDATPAIELPEGLSEPPVLSDPAGSSAAPDAPPLVEGQAAPAGDATPEPAVPDGN